MKNLPVKSPESIEAFAEIIAAAGTPQASAIVGQLVSAAATPRALALLGVRVLDAAHLLSFEAAERMLHAACEPMLAAQVQQLRADLLAAE